MFQDRLPADKVTGTLPNVAPYNASVRINDEYCWRSKAVAKQVVDAIGLAHLVSGVGQHRVADPFTLAPVFYRLNRCNHQRGCLCSSLLNCIILPLQLYELRVGLSTTDSLEKDQHHRSLDQLFR